jgi:hypothetical protein
MAIKYSIEKHAVAWPSKLLAQNGGKHIYNIKLATDTDNGNLVARGAFIDLDTYEEAAASTFEGIIQKKAANGNWYVEVVNPGDSLFVYMQAFIAEDWTNKWKKESNFYNAADEIVRGYELAVGDVFEISEEGFTGTPEAGKTVSVAGKKLVVA